MQDFSQRASAKTMTTNRLLPTSDHVSTSVYIYIYIPLEIIQKEERMVKINSPPGGGEINLHQKILLYYHWPSPKNNQNTKEIRGSNFKTVSTEKTITSKIYAFNMFKCIQPENNQFFPLPNVTSPLPNATFPPPPRPTTGTVLTHLESK